LLLPHRNLHRRRISGSRRWLGKHAAHATTAAKPACLPACPAAWRRGVPRLPGRAGATACACRCDCVRVQGRFACNIASHVCEQDIASKAVSPKQSAGVKIRPQLRSWAARGLTCLEGVAAWAAQVSCRVWRRSLEVVLLAEKGRSTCESSSAPFALACLEVYSTLPSRRLSSEVPQLSCSARKFIDANALPTHLARLHDARTGAPRWSPGAGLMAQRPQGHAWHRWFVQHVHLTD
jgi:hypothetical protein